MVTALALNDEIKADVVSITNLLVAIKMDVITLINSAKKMIEKGCIYVITDQMVIYIINTVDRLQDEDRNNLLSVWDSLFEAFDAADNKYQAYGIEALRSVYVSVHEKIREPNRNPVLLIFTQRLFWLYKLKATVRINKNGEIEISYYQIQDGNKVLNKM